MANSKSVYHIISKQIGASARRVCGSYTLGQLKMDYIPPKDPNRDDYEDFGIVLPRNLRTTTQSINSLEQKSIQGDKN